MYTHIYILYINVNIYGTALNSLGDFPAKHV